MLIQIELESDIPIYLQLKDRIIEGIASGRLPPGHPMPSIRQLAADLGVNLHTVNKAYNLLRQDGFIIIHRQRGVVVNPDASRISGSDLKRMRAQIEPIAAEAICRGMSKDDFIKLCEEIYSDFLEKRQKENGKEEIK